MNYFDDIKSVTDCVPMPWKNISGKNILITGATGLIGGAIVDILMSHRAMDFHVYASGRSVTRAKHRFSKYSDNPHFHFVEYDVTKPLKANETFHFIISAASGANPEVYSKDPVGVMKANLLGVDNLLSYGLIHNLERLVYISSSDIYGTMSGFVRENVGGYVNPVNYKSCYVASKLAGETLCLSYASEYGVSTSVVRPCHTFGPFFTESDTRAASQFIADAVYRDKIVLNSSGTQIRSWCYVVDCAFGILYVMLRGETGAVYNIASGESCTIRELAEIISDISGCEIMCEGKITEASYSQSSATILDISAIRKLGWNPQFSIQDGLRHTFNQLESIKNFHLW